MIQRDFKPGQKWRVVADDVQLSGMKPTGPYAQQGWAMRVPRGTVLTCTGCQMTFGDGVPVVKWADENGKWLANDCTLSPSEGGMWSEAPADGTLWPWSPATQALTAHGYAIDLRPAFEAEARKELNDAEALIARAAEHKGRWVLWDPDNDADGFLLVGDDPFAMAAEAVAHLEIEA
jgi:hypothetical protein